MYIIGISCFYHDSAVTLIKDGKTLYALQEERFTRIKHDHNFPTQSLKFLKNKFNLNSNNIDAVVFYEKPVLKFERIIHSFVEFYSRSFLSVIKFLPIWISNKLFQKKVIIKEIKKCGINLKKTKIFFSEHHLSHASSCFFPSGFENSAIIVFDGVGEWTTTSISIGKGNKIKLLKDISFPDSLGLLYSAFTYYLGFKVNSGEYKLMGLAPYGKPKYANLILSELVNLSEDGSFKLNLKYFNFQSDKRMITDNFIKLFNQNIKNSSEEFNELHFDIAASIQNVIEQIVLKICKYTKEITGVDNLCLSGGVALNCVANGKILESKYFKNIWIQPASGDAGGSLGAALAYWYIYKKNQRIFNKNDCVYHTYLGQEYTNYEIEKDLLELKAVFKKFDQKELIEITSEHLFNNLVVGWFQGREEFGPRALGNRSILANPTHREMQKKLNLKIKFRESFRPFAPAILIEKLEDWFNLTIESPFMLLVSQLKKEKLINSEKSFIGTKKINEIRSQIPGVTHVDNSARIQTVDMKRNKLFYELISSFNKKSGIPILINTSFNIRGEPIVHSPKDAYNCFMGTDMDILVIGNYLLCKKEQLNPINKEYKHSYNLD